MLTRLREVWWRWRGKRILHRAEKRLQHLITTPATPSPRLSGPREIAALMSGDLGANEQRVRQVIQDICAGHPISPGQCEVLLFRELSSGKALEDVVRQMQFDRSAEEAASAFEAFGQAHREAQEKIEQDRPPR